MKTSLKAMAVMASIGAMVFGGTSAQAATGTADAKAKILTAIQVQNTTALDFATVVAGAAAATVSLDTAGTRVCGAGLVCMGTPTAASFNVTGSKSQVVTLSLPSPTVTLNAAAGGGTMTATLALPATTALTLDGTTGAAQFSVGGTLSVGANQADGDYKGSFNVSVNYQ